MSTNSVSVKSRPVNQRCRNFDKYADPTPEALPALWREAVALESLAPVRLRGGLARARTALLASVPTWGLPEILDSLREATA